MRVPLIQYPPSRCSTELLSIFIKPGALYERPSHPRRAQRGAAVPPERPGARAGAALRSHRWGWTRSTGWLRGDAGGMHGNKQLGKAAGGHGQGAAVLSANGPDLGGLSGLLCLWPDCWYEQRGEFPAEVCTLKQHSTAFAFRRFTPAPFLACQASARLSLARAA
jgi:hypothetical protein